MVRAKFSVNSVKDLGDSVQVSMNPVYSGSEENKQFWNATPNGSIVLFINNKNAADYFKQGREYYIDFTDATVENQSPAGA